MTDSNRMTAIFISYSRADSEFTLQVAKDLRTAGVDVWLDQLSIAAGERWDREIQQALHNCESVLVILSPDAVISENVMDEVSYALDENKPVIPVLYRNCEVFFRLRRIQRIEFTGDYQRGMDALLNTLRSSDRLGIDRTGEFKAAPIKYQLRSVRDENLSVEKVNNMLQTHGFYCTYRKYLREEWGNPDGKGIVHEYELLPGERVIYDRATGLYWQKRGSRESMHYDDAEYYLEDLNDTKFGGFNDWRLPTLEEAISLLEPELQSGELFISPLFDDKQETILTVDRCEAPFLSEPLPWVVYLISARCFFAPADGGVFIRAVRSTVHSPKMSN